MTNKTKFYFRKYRFIGVSFLFVLFFAIQSCKENEQVPNLAPDTKIWVDTIDLKGENRINSSLKITWFGTDADGYVAHYQISTDGVNWHQTKTQDTIIKFPIPPGQDTADIRFYVRSIDNEGAIDPSPASLGIPIKNSPPIVNFDEDALPPDSVFGVATFRWRFSDDDGSETVSAAYIKLNEGEWIEIDKNKSLISLVSDNPKDNGTTTASIYYNNEANPALTAPGLKNNSTNNIYLKVLDIAGAESEVDTLANIFFKRQTADILLVSGQSAGVTKVYENLLSTVGSYDIIDLLKNNGEQQPDFWDPTFKLTISSYDKVFMCTDQSIFVNPLTQQSATLLDFAATSLQFHAKEGGKAFITTSFTAGQDISLIREVLPIDSLSLSSGQAIISNDSIVYPVNIDTTLRDLPILSPQNLILGSDPFVPSIDAIPLYKANLLKIGAWDGPDVVASRRIINGKTVMVFFSIEIHQLNKDKAQLEELFDVIFNDYFQ